MKYNRLPLLASLLIPLASPAEEGLLQPPSDANDYVRVWSETIGVERVIRADRAPQPGGSLDFYITTTNVLDGFKALVRLEEINGDAWKLIEPKPGVPVTMRPGERIEYVIRDQTGIEPDQTGHVALYRVDVCVSDVQEEIEESIGATLLQKYPIAGYGDSNLTPFLAPVTIICQTPDGEDMVDLLLDDSASAVLLVLNSSGVLVGAETKYSANELKQLDFFLLGLRESQISREGVLRATHRRSGCQDVARFTVNATYTIYSVQFDQDVILEAEPSSSPSRQMFAYNKPQYCAEPSAEIGSYLNYSHPVCYVRDSQVVISAVIRHSNAFLEGPVHVRAVSDAFEIAPTEVPKENVNAYSINLINAVSVRPLANTIDFHDPLRVRWFVSTDGCKTWKNAGESSNRFYVVWKQPSMPTLNYETAFFISCQAAKGCSGQIDTSAEVQVFNTIWNAFKMLNLQRAWDHRLLTYYGYTDVNQNGHYDSDDLDCSRTFNHDYLSLVESGNGDCQAFFELLTYCLFAQGLTSINRVAYKQCLITSINSTISFDSDSGVPIQTSLKPFAFANWTMCGMAQDYKVMCQFAGVDGSRDTDLELEEGQCKDSVGVRGQGSSPNPPSRFINHVVFWWNGQLYDPSYGLGAFDDIKQYESDVLRGFFEDRIGPAGETTYLSTNLKPNDGDNHDQSDLDLQYTVF